MSVGTRITLGGHSLQVKAARPNELVVTIDDGPDVIVDSVTRDDILPDVFVSATTGLTSRRLAFETAGAIRVERIEGPRM